MTEFSSTCDTEWTDNPAKVASSSFIEYFAMLKDVRVSGRTSHSLLEVIFITVCAYICGANSWEGVLEFARARKSWLRRYIPLENGIPSPVTYWRVFAHLEPSAFEQCFRDWAHTLLGSSKHIAIDGKTLRGVHDRKNPNAQLVLVSAWATDKGLLLGQVRTDIKSNEITAIPRLLDMICVKDCLISIDAAGCQTHLAEKISGMGGEYLLALKGNQGVLKSEVETFFQDAVASNWEYLDFERCESVEKGHGRIDTRTVYLVKEMADCIDEKRWPKIQGVIMVNSKRRIKDKETEESRYYITSSNMGVTEAALAIRKHWAIENGLHWSLDVGFREDRQVAQKMNQAENLAVLRRIAFTLLKQEGSSLSLENKRMKAAMSEEYLDQVLGLTAMKV